MLAAPCFLIIHDDESKALTNVLKSVLACILVAIILLGNDLDDRFDVQTQRGSGFLPNFGENLLRLFVRILSGKENDWDDGSIQLCYISLYALSIDRCLPIEWLHCVSAVLQQRQDGVCNSQTLNSVRTHKV